MKKVLLVIFFLVMSGQAQEIQKPELNVLFIGNSLTYYNDMPQVLQEMLQETDPNIHVGQSTIPGMSLNGHLDDIITSTGENSISTRPKIEGEWTDTEKKICEKDWDVIILQTGGVGVLIPEAREFQVNPAVERIKEIIDDPRARFILFHTWASKSDYPKEYCYLGRTMDLSLGFDKEYCSPEIVDLEQELELLREGYCSIAGKTGIEMTEHGRLHYRAGKDHPLINLLEDSMHPSESGAFLNAGIFYRILTGKEVSALAYAGKLEHGTAGILKGLADQY